MLVKPDVLQSLRRSAPEFAGLVEGQLVLRGDDGLPYLNYLQATYTLNKETAWLVEYMSGSLNVLRQDSLKAYDYITTDYIAEHRRAIEKAVETKPGKKADPILLAKYHSLAVYHNKVVDRLVRAIRNANETFGPDTNLDQLKDFRLAMFAALGRAGQSDKVMGFVRPKFAGLAGGIEALESEKIPLKRVFAQLY
ncbi:MAG: hypothetical protein A2Y72_01410 [Chloroflexi bacterium RBG_13_53_26]|nr:MAG: hypothetical protein A2Y72_01410 [Chloroflexi bacterium RBG_13_53_26]